MRNKKIVLLSVGITVCILGQLFLNVRTLGADQKTPKSDPAKQSAWQDYLQNQTDRNPNAQDILTTKNDTPGGPLKQFTITITFVIILGIAAFYLSKKFLPKFATTHGTNISVIETIRLGPHKTLHLLQIGDNQKLLIGSTNENINILADVTEAVLERAIQKSQNS